MIHAYDEQYLDDAMKCLGEAMDYAVNGCGLDMDAFLRFLLEAALLSSLERESQRLFRAHPGRNWFWRC